MDVKTAFLNGNLNEEIYMTVPEGIDAATSSNSVCKLNRTLYGLKQSLRMWNQKIDNFLLHEQGFTYLNSDHGTYIRRSNQSLAIITLYIDDLLILTDSLETMTTLKLNLSQTFAMTDCSEIHHFLGIRITRDQNKCTITLDQGHYIDQILTRFNMTNCKPVATPLDASIQLKITEDAEITDVTLYQQIVSSAMYLMIATRPDIAATISIISQFTSKPTRDHHHATKHLLHYLKGTRNYKLHLGCQDDSDLSLIGYSDTNWGGDVNTRKSTTGYLFYLSGGVISWSSKRQATVALSSTEAEYMALTHATKEAIWLRSLLDELGFKQHHPTTLFEDNQSAIALAKNPVYHMQSKHIDIQYHFTREKLESNEIELVYKPTIEMIADALTKPLTRPKLEPLVIKMGLHE